MNTGTATEIAIPLSKSKIVLSTFALFHAPKTQYVENPRQNFARIDAQRSIPVALLAEPSSPELRTPMILSFARTVTSAA